MTENEIDLEELQQAFSKRYPFLKMELASHAGARNNAVLDLLSSLTLKKIQAGKRKINMEGNITIAQFEADMQNNWHVPVQILRRSGSMWIGTSLTKDWTLEHQNREGELLSTHPTD